MAISGSTAGHGFFGRQPADAAERRRHPPSPRWGAGQRGAEVRRFSVSGAGRTEGARVSNGEMLRKWPNAMKMLVKHHVSPMILM